ncbi:uncharacterized protein N7506_001369 [Penicillium brevicompactum]|uniref:uncharacterized protein n=1 Tax=Penicillium brevicompactum TaxID=5074 RepID=UPI00254171D4|nr:uncharacterized protein N7506_001369 [Penicillium brevicompactum]KAJ5348116.1 hypothetical protein N7506_001369 [Penicillium brevicompactum]
MLSAANLTNRQTQVQQSPSKPRTKEQQDSTLRTACDCCHAAKIRCSGGAPCTRCARDQKAKIGKPRGSLNKKTIERLRMKEKQRQAPQTPPSTAGSVDVAEPIPPLPSCDSPAGVNLDLGPVSPDQPMPTPPDFGLGMTFDDLIFPESQLESWLPETTEGFQTYNRDALWLRGMYADSTKGHQFSKPIHILHLGHRSLRARRATIPIPQAPRYTGRFPSTHQLADHPSSPSPPPSASTYHYSPNNQSDLNPDRANPLAPVSRRSATIFAPYKRHPQQPNTPKPSTPSSSNPNASSPPSAPSPPANAAVATLRPYSS